MENKINVGIGFATGRKNFKKVLRSYIYNCQESGLVNNENVSLNLFVAYDLKYNNTKKTDYTPISKDLVNLIDSKHFLGVDEVEESKKFLIDNGVVNLEESAMIFGRGYAAQRNIVLYSAIKNKMDYLLFLDDDEYAVAVTRTSDIPIWSGQEVLKTHLVNIKNADITYGYHCGYISPIPYMEFSEILTEEKFILFIEAISNDIVNWETTKEVMKNGGVSYADTNILKSKDTLEVEEKNNTKFISGSNLCINLTDPKKINPFYNPPRARGEDTFLSTCLSDRTVLRVPCYAFHDGFSIYNHLLEGVLPIELKRILPDSEKVKKRFYKACIGWVRYKPLYLYITNRDTYEERIKQMRENLKLTLPSVCEYFGMQEFNNIIKELNKYDKNVVKHYDEFMKTKDIWSRVMNLTVDNNLK